ncbi:LysR family transcriptional regulator [Telmatocola sphagniphila]|jgi:molybdate transport system regulatory protein|uniref:LysR family transcriptional regulator n=1 Tax=Telmatocola sphagniphila TaxID=1123043 RepID=A0A8E6B445_9BACT|nr:LysR family transcriptional regulator [Telmatocola sphagniphila]QVL31366.1 LysR family transcriptional regulator [Telmatocola sphagniphila]
MLDQKNDWNLKVRVWIERDGEKVLGPGRYELLGHIDTHHSISAAAKQMKMSYRRAWSLVQDINRAAGETLVEVSTGGKGGGGAILTPRGKEAVRIYESLLKKTARLASDFNKPARKSS